MVQGGYNPAHNDTRFDDWIVAVESYPLNDTDGR